MKRHISKQPNTKNNNGLQKVKARAIFLHNSFCHCNFATRKFNSDSFKRIDTVLLN